jgi:predicted HTH domain antitoxin
MKKLIRGYHAASELTGIPVRTLRTLVAKRIIRVRKPIHDELFFDEAELEEDLEATTQEKRS